MKQMLKDIKMDCDAPVVIHCDNSVAIDISKNLVFHSKTEHISIKYNFLKERWKQMKLD